MTSPDGSKKRRIMIITADESIIEQLQNNGNASLFKSIILDSNGENVEVSHSPSSKDIPSTPANKKTKSDVLTCVVCGSAAHGYNFDAISCESCKAFFRRNALKDSATLECRRNNDCDITSESRRRCSACRLAKCLKSGMKRDRLLTAEQKAAKRRKIEENRTLTLQSHVEDNPKSTPEIIDEKPSTNQSLVSKGTNLLLLKDFTDLLPNESQPLLSSEELQRVETIQLSFEQRIELAARDGLPWNPSSHATTLLQHLNARSVTAVRLLSFFKQIPEFTQLNADDKLTLVKYNLMPLILLNCTLAYNKETNSIVEDDRDAPWDDNIFRKLHGEEAYQSLKKIFESFVRLADHDQRIIQLALVILILTKGFSSNDDGKEPTLNDGIAVYRAQNYYTELLWKYLEATHGLGKAAQIFHQLIGYFISWQTLRGNFHQDLINALSPSEMNELLPIMKSLLNFE